MTIFENRIIKLDYEPSSDILSFEMPSVDSIVMEEMKLALDIIVDYVRNYDVKKILLDARKTEIWVESDTYGRSISKFYNDLSATRLQRVARLITPDSTREKVIKQVLDNMSLAMEVEEFKEVSPALTWLKFK